MTSMKNRTVMAVAVATCLLGFNRGQAAMLHVSNASFESPAIGVDAGVLDATDWSEITGGGGLAGLARPSATFLTTVPNGNQIGATTSPSGFGTLGQFASSVVSFTPVTVVAGTTYTLSGLIGRPITGGTGSAGFITIGSTSTLPGAYDTAVPGDFFSLKNELEVPQDGGSALALTTVATPAADSFTSFSLQFTAQAGAGYLGEYLYFTLGNAANDGNVIYWESIEFIDDSVIPEPASAMLLGLGAVLIASRKRSRSA